MYENGLNLAGQPLWFDPLAQRPIAILSSASSAPLLVHERTLVHPLVHTIHPRRRKRQAFLTPAYDETVLLGEWDIRLRPAGVSPGSCQVLLEGPRGRALYVGPFNTRTTAVTRDFAPTRAPLLLVDLDWIRPGKDGSSRQAHAHRVLQAAAQVLDQGGLPLLFLPIHGLPQELLLAMDASGPPVLVHEAFGPALRVLREAGLSPKVRVRRLRGCRMEAGHLIFLPEALRPQVEAAPGRVFLGFQAQRSGPAGREPPALDASFPRFDLPDERDLALMLEATEPQVIVALATGIEAWRERLPAPPGVALRFIEKEAQTRLL